MFNDASLETQSDTLFVLTLVSWENKTHPSTQRLVQIFAGVAAIHSIQLRLFARLALVYYDLDVESGVFGYCTHRLNSPGTRASRPRVFPGLEEADRGRNLSGRHRSPLSLVASSGVLSRYDSRTNETK